MLQTYIIVLYKQNGGGVTIYINTETNNEYTRLNMLAINGIIKIFMVLSLLINKAIIKNNNIPTYIDVARML
jgi:hypothetical protein